jgi:hypothetical protein
MGLHDNLCLMAFQGVFGKIFFKFQKLRIFSCFFYSFRTKSPLEFAYVFLSFLFMVFLAYLFMVFWLIRSVKILSYHFGRYNPS